LTRFKLELAMLRTARGHEARRRRDGAHVEAYLAFARGDTGEQSAPTDMSALLGELKADAERNGIAPRSSSMDTGCHSAAGLIQAMPCQPDANAARHGDTISISDFATRAG